MNPSLCESLVDFAEGDLEAGPAALFRLHLRTCEDCRRGLIDHMTLVSQLSELGRDRASRSDAWQTGATEAPVLDRRRRAVVREILYAAWLVGCGAVGCVFVRSILDL